MDYNTKEFYVNRICAGIIKLRVSHNKGDALFFCKPTLQEKYIAEEIYRDTFNQAVLENNFSEDELNSFLFEHGIWDNEKETILLDLKENLNKLKTKGIGAGFKNDEIIKIKQAINITKNKIKELEEERTSFNFLTCEGIASIAKTKFIVGSSLFYLNNQKVFNDEDFWKSDGYFLQEVIESYLTERLSETGFRELARSEPWRTIWNIQNGNLFKYPVIEYTEEQKNLVIWSKFYDNVYENPERPATSIINDDDFLDGWAILQRKKYEGTEAARKAEGLMSDKIKNAGEVFIPTGSDRKSISEVEELNEGMSKAVKKARMNKLIKEGVVREQDMPDTKRKYREAIITEMRKRQGVKSG